MRIRYTPAALEDLRQLRAYLGAEFGGEVAARTLAKIVDNISSLKTFPKLMGDLSAKIRRPSKYRYFLCSKYSVAILSADANVISVIRVLDVRSDYASVVFQDLTWSAND